MQIGRPVEHPAASLFLASLPNLGAPRVLEVGTLRWEAGNPTHHKAWVPNASQYVMSDVDEGLDVDVVADVHALPFADDSFDVFIGVSVWEHLVRPWVAAQEVARVVRPGGLCYVATHQSFPLHGYPHDYFRFSREGLAVLFEDAGFEVSTSYAYPCKITPPREVTRWNTAAESYLNVDLFGRKKDK